MSDDDYTIPGLINETYIKSRKIDEIYTLHKNNRMSTPKFQRNPSVWKDKQRQEFILAICKRENVPQFFVQNYQERGREKFRLLEGQQRIETIARFMDNEIKLDEKVFGASDEEWVGGKKVSSLVGKKWKDLESEEQKRFKDYPLVFFELKGEEDAMRDVYLAIGSKGSPQNPPEKRRAKFYKTEFNQVTENFAEQNRRFYLDNGIMNQGKINRLFDCEITAELFVLVLNGPQGSAGTLDKYYQRYDKFDDKNMAIKKVSGAFRMIKRIFPEGLKGTLYDAPTDIYALVGALAPIDVLYTFDEKSWEKIEKELIEFRQEIKNGGERGKIGSSVRNYWESIQDATRGKRHRTMRIEAIQKKLWKHTVIKDNKRLFSDQQKKQIWNIDPKHKCQICNRVVKSYDDFAPDHIRPHSKGGKTEVSNGQISHKACNIAKMAKME